MESRVLRPSGALGRLSRTWCTGPIQCLTDVGERVPSEERNPFPTADLSQLLLCKDHVGVLGREPIGRAVADEHHTLPCSLLLLNRQDLAGAASDAHWMRRGMGQAQPCRPYASLFVATGMSERPARFSIGPNIEPKLIAKNLEAADSRQSPSRELNDVR